MASLAVLGSNGGLCIAGGSLTYILDTKVNKTGYTYRRLHGNVS